MLPVIALLLAGEGEVKCAVEWYAVALRPPFITQSRWSADVAGNTLAEVTATLPAGRVALLQGRGRTGGICSFVCKTGYACIRILRVIDAGYPVQVYRGAGDVSIRSSLFLYPQTSEQFHNIFVSTADGEA